MKKLLSLILCLVLLSGVLVACAPEQQSRSPLDNNQMQSANSTEYCNHTYQNGYCTKCGTANFNYLGTTPCNHTYVGGVCTKCSATNPNYVPAEVINPTAPCAHTYVGGVCTKCNATNPNYTPADVINPTAPCAHTYYNGTCTKCGNVDKNYVANQPILPQACAHNYVDGTCTKCQTVDVNYVAPTYQKGLLTLAGDGKYLLADENGNYGGTRDRGRYGDGAPLNGQYDQPNSLWYATNNDFYHMKSTKLTDGTPARTMYTGFAPYQQTMANTSGIAGMVATLNYWGETVTTETELDLFNRYQQVNNVTLNGRETAQGLVNLWQDLGYTASLGTFKRASARADTAKNAMAWFQEHLSAGEMIFVHSYDNDSARWKVIVGFDTMDNATDQYYDDVLIFADSYDNFDHYQDGYSTVCAVQFVQWWLDLNATSGAQSNDCQAVLVSPKQAPTINRVLASEDPAQIAPDFVPQNYIIRNWGQHESLPAGSYGGHYWDASGYDYGGGTCMDGKRDHHATHNYYKFPDFHNITAVEGSRWYLTGYRGYCQTMASSCGNCAAFSILNYYGFDMESYNEVTIVSAYEKMHKQMEKVSTYRHVSKEGYGYVMKPALESMGVKGVTSTFYITDDSRFSSKKGITDDMLARPFENHDQFIAFVKENLAKGQPVAISWRPNGGHWEAIIGYDTMGTDYLYDDVIVFADSGDTWDHYQEGFNVFPATLVFRHWWSLRFDYTQDLFVIDRQANAKV